MFPRTLCADVSSRFNAVGFEDIANGGVADVVAYVRQRTANTVVTPRRILFREPHGQVNDHLSGSWPTRFLLFAVGVVPLVGDQLTVPPQDRVRREQGSNLLELLASELLASEELAFDCQATSLLIG